jgi:hypothetical protein
MNLKLAVLALTALLCASIAKADGATTWDFSFYSLSDITDQPNGVVSGSGSFQTLPANESPYLYSLEIVSTTGTMNGSPMSFVPLIYNAIDSDTSSGDDPFLNFAFYFAVDGSQYYIHDVDVDEAPLYTGDTLYGPTYNGQLLAVTLTDAPASVTEPRTLLLLVAGLGALLLVPGMRKRVTGYAAA